MRPLLLPFLLFLTTAKAQLINGSFEMDGSPSLQAWEWTCEDPEALAEAAPGAGAWSTTKQPGNAKGCFPSYLFQRLPGVEHGELLELSTWVKCPEFGNCQGGSIGLGRVNAGQFELEETSSSTEMDWTFISITDTVEVGPGDTAIVVLNSGFTGGPVFVQGTAYDGVSVLSTLGVVESEPAPAMYFDRASQQLHLAVASGELGVVRVFDLTGKSLPLRSERTSASSVRIDMNGLPFGVYFVSASSLPRSVRFVNW